MGGGTGADDYYFGVHFARLVGGEGGAEGKAQGRGGCGRGGLGTEGGGEEEGEGEAGAEGDGGGAVEGAGKQFGGLGRWWVEIVVEEGVYRPFDAVGAVLRVEEVRIKSNRMV